MSTCKLCSCTITDPVMKRTYFDEDYPLIDIGPYCATCMDKIRICSGCHHPHVFEVDIKYFSRGNFYCTTCESQMSFCSECQGECTIYKEVDGQKYCEKCYKKKYTTCGCCDKDLLKRDMVTDNITKAQYAGVWKKYTDICPDCFNSVKSRFKKYDVSECENCGRIYANDKPERHYCDRCEEQLPKCCICKKQHHNYKRVNVDNSVDGAKSGKDNFMCPTCFGTLKKCDNCQKYTLKPVTVRGRFNRSSLCTVCGDTGHDMKECKTCLSLAVLLEDGRCARCHQTYTEMKCETCGMILDENGDCRKCRTAKIYNYSTKPRLYFHYSKRDVKHREALFMGFENEISFTDRSDRDVGLKELYASYGPDILLAKSDGSISGYGYEVVTQPMSMDMYHHLDLSRTLNSRQNASSSCGMHVHVDRKAFSSDLHIFKVCQFVHNNEKFCDFISGRSYNNYSQKFENKPSKIVKDAKGGRAGRTRRVNLSNPHTIEFRMFAGCTKEFEIRYRLEFVHALVTWAKIAPIKDFKPENIKKFVADNSKVYPNLFKFIQTGE